MTVTMTLLASGGGLGVLNALRGPCLAALCHPALWPATSLYSRPPHAISHPPSCGRPLAHSLSPGLALFPVTASANSRERDGSPPPKLSGHVMEHI